MPTERKPKPKLATGATTGRRLALTGLIVWLLSPVAIVVVLLYTSVNQTLTPSAQPVWVPASVANESVSSPIDIALTWSTTEPLRAPSWSGVLQAVFVAPGDVVADGSKIARVDGVVRVAVQTPEPFYRPISFGLRGADVSSLNNYLTRAGYADVTGEVATWGTSQGIAALANALGADGATTFDPGWFIYLPAEKFTVATVAVSAGTAASSLGTPLAEATPTLTSATVVPFGSIQNSDTAQGEPEAGLDPIEVKRLASAVPVDQVLTFGADELLLADDRTTVSADSLAQIAGSARAASNIVQGNLVRQSEPGDLLVPSAAVFAGSGGEVCVLVEGDDEATAVTVVAETGGFAVVRGDVERGERVQVAVTGAQRRCG